MLNLRFSLHEAVLLERSDLQYSQNQNRQPSALAGVRENRKKIQTQNDWSKCGSSRGKEKHANDGTNYKKQSKYSILFLSALSRELQDIKHKK